MIVLDTRKLSTANVHSVFHQSFKQPTTHIGLIIIQLLMRLDTSLGRTLQRQTPDLLLGIVRFLIDTDLINLVLNERFSLIDSVADNWGQSPVIVPDVCISILIIAGTSVRTDGKI